MLQSEKSDQEAMCGYKVNEIKEKNMDEFFDVINENGEYTNSVASKNEYHKRVLWHGAVVLFIISKDNKKVLLQQRSANKKLWPNLWDITAGGHVVSGEFGHQAVIRETKEELGVDFKKNDLEFIGAATSENIKNGIINRHSNYYFIAHIDVNLKDITLQEEEVQDVRWFNKEDIIKKINNNYEGLTDKDVGTIWLNILS